MDARPELGRRGEDLAESVYRRLGFDIVQRNYRCRQGEIDLIARRGRVLVFCEVKTRRTDMWGTPAEAVGFRKQARCDGSPRCGSPSRRSAGCRSGSTWSPL